MAQDELSGPLAELAKMGQEASMAQMVAGAKALGQATGAMYKELKAAGFNDKQAANTAHDWLVATAVGASMGVVADPPTPDEQGG